MCKQHAKKWPSIFSCDQAALWMLQSVHPSVRPSVFRWSNKWNWYSSGLYASTLVWHTCASTLSGWVLYRQLELTKLTRPDLHQVVGLFIQVDVCPSVCHTFLTMFPSSYHQELLSMTKVTFIQKVKVRGQRSRSQRSTPNLAVSGP